MSVSTRNTFFAAISAIALAGGAWASGGMGGDKAGSPKGQGVVIPGASIAVPGASVGGGSGCCGGMNKGQNVIIPGANIGSANVVVGAPNIGINPGGVSITRNSTILDAPLNVVQPRQERNFLGGGGGYAEPAGAVTPSAIAGLNVDGLEETYTETVTEQVPTTQTTCIDSGATVASLRPVQAICIDDKGTPHPASRPSSEDLVDNGYSGEIFRCMSGTSMQVLLGDMRYGKSDFKNASGFSCKKGEALVHTRGGQLTCKPQIPQRNCNERSLLRRNGTGIKLVETRTRAACVPTQTTVMQPVTRQVERTRPAPTAPIVLDGGVGQSVF